MHMMMLQMVFVFGFFWGTQLKRTSLQRKKNTKHPRGQQTHNRQERDHMPIGHLRNLPILGKWYDHLT
jgi:hypothetical protein